jgi:hypothetical protein
MHLVLLSLLLVMVSLCDCGFSLADQLDQLKKGETVEIRNGKIEMFQGFMRLEVDKWGKIVPSRTPLAEVNLAKNMSSVEYELVEQQ